MKYNNLQPISNISAKIPTKRADVSSNRYSEDTFHCTSTTYYITYKVESGSRMEFRVDAKAYGLCTEGDIGKLTFQGTRYISFERNA